LVVIYISLIDLFHTYDVAYRPIRKVYPNCREW